MAHIASLSPLRLASQDSASRPAKLTALSQNVLVIPLAAPLPYQDNHDRQRQQNGQDPADKRRARLKLDATGNGVLEQ